MSLANPDEEYEDILPKEKKRFKLQTALSKLKLFGILILIGLILGVLLGHFIIEPLINEETSVCKTCIATKELLTKENECLYEAVPNAQEVVNNCSVI